MPSDDTRPTRRHFCLAPAMAGLLAGTRSALTAAPFPGKSEVFLGGQNGYKLYRIPGIVVTRRGTVLTYAEARRNSGSDWGSIDLALRRSTDGGRTFSAPWFVPPVPGTLARNPVALEHHLAQPTDVTYSNPVAIAGGNGQVHLLFCVEYLRVFYARSEDDGVTFSRPVEITGALAAFRPEFPWRVVATGPGHGIETHGGRLLVPVWLSLGTGAGGHGDSVNATIYSDDRGTTWHRGAIAIPSSAEFPSPNETVLAQLADGRVMLNARTISPHNRRTVTVSPDGVTGWAPPRFQEDLPDPICAAGMVRFSTRKTGGRDRLLFSNLDSLTRADGKNEAGKDRRNLTVRLSYDEGASWTVKRALEPGPAGYSDLAVLPDGTILCVYETETAEARPAIVLARFNLEWLTEGKDGITKRLKPA